MARDLTSLRESNTKELQVYLTKGLKQIAAALPEHINPKRMARLALTALRINPRLAECDPSSVFASVLLASQCGLEIGVQGQAFLVPYWNARRNQLECQFIPGWQGINDLITRSGRGTVSTGVIYDGDTVDYEEGSRPYIRVKRGGEWREDKIVAAYAVGWKTGSEVPIIEYWPVAKIIAHRDKVIAKFKAEEQAKHYSHKHPEMYYRKVMLLQVAKYMPKSIELSRVMSAEAQSAQGDGITLEAAIEGSYIDTFDNDNSPQDANMHEDSGQKDGGTPPKMAAQNDLGI